MIVKYLCKDKYIMKDNEGKVIEKNSKMNGG